MTNILAFSGGPDSMYLLHKLLPKKPILAHLNHNLRGAESDQDEIFCKKIAKKYGLIIETEKVTLTKKNEETARIARYNFLEKIRQKYHAKKILTAHHLNDSIETFILNLTRGTGLKGLTGIKSDKQAETAHIMSRFATAKLNIVRPLLQTTKQEILSYLKKHKIPYREDSSNSDTKYSRNLIRLEIIPRLKKLNPNFEKTFLTNIKNLQEAQSFIDSQTPKWQGEFFAKKFSNLHPCLQSNLLLQINREFSQKNLTELKNLITKNKTGTEKLGIGIQYGKAILTNSKKGSIHPPAVTFSILKTHPKSLNSKTAIFLNFDKIRKLENIKTRTFKPGDSIKPLGLKGKSQKLQDVFTNKKIPAYLRNKIPILTLNNREIIAAGCITISENYKVTTLTKKILKVNFGQ